jgi:hypothetical protein
MRKVHLIREFTPDAYEFALSSWSWIGTGDKIPRFASCFGDMFLESVDGWWFLDTVEGTLERRWSSMDDMFADLEGDEGRAEYLLEETLNTALDQGLRLGEDEVFAFLPPPAVTGTMSVASLAPLRFAIAANLAGRIHGELNGVQPDAGASALFAAQKFAAAQNSAAQNQAAHQAAQSQAAQRLAAAPAFEASNPQAGPWEPTQQVNTGAYPSYQPASEPAYETQYAAGSELDYGSGQQGYNSGTYAAAPAGYTAPASYTTPSAASAGAHAAAPGAAPQTPAATAYGAQGGHSGYDYLDSSHTLDSGQFSQYIADQYNTGQVAAVGYDAPAPAQPKPRPDGRWSYA